MLKSKTMRKLNIEELNRPDIESYKKLRKIPLTIVLDNIRSMYNVGSVFRTSDAFLVEKVYLCGITARPPHKEIRKTALGATESVSWEYVEKTEEVVRDLKASGYQILAIEQVEESISLENFEIEPEKKYALVLGNEVFGVEQEVINLCDKSIEIPQAGTKHSLNVSVCAGIVIWNFFEKLNS